MVQVSGEKKKEILDLAQECPADKLKIVEQFFNENTSPAYNLEILQKKLEENVAHYSIVYDAIVKDSLPLLKLYYLITNTNVNNNIIINESNGETPLQCALNKGNYKIALFLTNQIYKITLNNHMELIKFLQTKFNDCYISDFKSGVKFSTLLFFASTLNKDAFEMILSSSPINHLYDNHPHFDATLLNLIISWGNKTILKLAIKYGANLNYGSNFYDKPLYEAILYCPKMISILIKNGARLHSNDDNFERHHVIPLRDLGRIKYYKIIKKMKKFGIDFYKKFLTNENELHDLCRFAADDNCKSFLLAIEKGADINHMNDDNYCLLKFAINDNLLERYSKDSIILILVSIIVKMIENRDFVNKDNIECLNDKKARTFFVNCKKEIYYLRGKKIIENISITYYDFLTSDVQKLTALARNKEILRNFRLSNYAKEFPIYEQHLKRNFERSIWRLQKVEEICEIFVNIKFPPLIVEKICGYLNDHELTMSKNYFQSLKEFLLQIKIV
ncbi:uncharacterized protein LOC127286566 isoform X2 [Leptopilina boulardi]|uniref:uncharacterized protein LOC127286566 isoform X2 n=1 Tax=Leptopilina boulardi TaxID=63433 RepID=UPI0021F63AB8|nr:uncharacterized protein LOC127286566 isoform X2 [Leptopilina boulardi]